MDSREKIQKFLNMELTAVTEDFNRKFSAPALHLLNESEELFIGQFFKFDNGEMIVKFRASRAFPRKGEYVQAMYLPKSIQDYRKWDGLTYEDLYKNRLKGSEAVCIWQSKSSEEGFVLLGFRGIEMDFAEYISKASGAIIILGPHRPPIDYLANLYKFSQDESSQKVADILDYPYSPCESSPILIKNESPVEFVHRQIGSSNITILQGPPGTGKTQLIAELCARLCKEGKSVLVTALTNRALIEVATKSALAELLSDGKIFKSNLTIDEQHEVPRLVATKQIIPIKGSVVMGTYYITSGFAANLAGENAFDVVIMDEASQALTPMFAASHKIGLTNLWVGDSAQLGPVVALNGDRVTSNGFDFLIDGLCTMVHKRQLPVYQLTKTYRLTQRNADYTGFFYNKSLISAKDNQGLGFKSLEKLIHSGGGPTLLLTDMDVADATPQFAMDLATYLVFSILEEKPTTEIAVLSCFRKSARALQKAVAVILGIGNKVLIDTIARVQGLTTDVTIFFIPNTSLIRSLEPRLFNVATSRAKSHTIIIADKNICDFPHMNHNVRSFMEKLKAESCLYIPAKANDSKSITNNSTFLLS
jgi:hypothetical protein